MEEIQVVEGPCGCPFRRRLRLRPPTKPLPSSSSSAVPFRSTLPCPASFIAFCEADFRRAAVAATNVFNV